MEGVGVGLTKKREITRDQKFKRTSGKKERQPERCSKPKYKRTSNRGKTGGERKIEEKNERNESILVHKIKRGWKRGGRN